MTNKEFIEELSHRLEKSEKETAALLASFTGCVSQALQENKTVVLQDFGSFEVEKKVEYISVNPVTRQRFLVPPELVVSFKSATSLKGRVNNVLSDE